MWSLASEDLLGDPGGGGVDDGAEAGELGLKAVGGLNGAQGLDGADEGAALAEDAVSEFSSHYGSVILSGYNSYTVG